MVGGGSSPRKASEKQQCCSGERCGEEARPSKVQGGDDRGQGPEEASWRPKGRPRDPGGWCGVTEGATDRGRPGRVWALRLDRPGFKSKPWH